MLFPRSSEARWQFSVSTREGRGGAVGEEMQVCKKSVDVRSDFHIHLFMFEDNSAEKRRETGVRIRKRRVEVGLTQQELAEALGHSSSHRINQIELGRLRLYAEELPILCWKLDCRVSDIVPLELSSGTK